MAEFGKRPEVTVDTMGKVHNPSGQGVRAISSQVKSKKQATLLHKNNNNTTTTTTDTTASSTTSSAATTKPPASSSQPKQQAHDTVIKEVGSARRNITRKKSDYSHDSRNKKQGGHGKGQWSSHHHYYEDSNHKNHTSTDDGAMLILDKKDPLYDEQEVESGRYILASGDPLAGATGEYDGIASKAIYGNMWTRSEFKLQVAQAILEYFDSSDAEEVIRSIQETKCPSFYPEVVKKAIGLSLDQGPRERELVSRLLTCLHPTPLSEKDMEAGFDLLLRSLDDLSIDIPDAKTMVGSFLARAVVDEVLPPAFLSAQNNDHPGELVIEKAVGLLSREHCTARLEKVWGPGDGRPVAELKQVMDQLLKEYLMSRELDEAARCVGEMNAAHFHHELVKRGVTAAMESASDPSDALDAMVALFAFLVKNSVVSENQVAKGVSRLRKVLADLTLDVPTAPALMEEFESMARDAGCLPAEVTTESKLENGHA